MLVISIFKNRGLSAKLTDPKLKSRKVLCLTLTIHAIINPSGQQMINIIFICLGRKLSLIVTWKRSLISCFNGHMIFDTANSRVDLRKCTYTHLSFLTRKLLHAGSAVGYTKVHS